MAVPLLARRRPTDLTLARPLHRDTRIGRALTASGTVLNLRDNTEGKRLARARQSWQADAWAYRRALGELRYATTYLRNSAMRMLLYPAVLRDGEIVNVNDASDVPQQVRDVANEAVTSLGGGSNGRAQLLGTLTENFEVAGECVLYGRDDPDTHTLTWSIKSTSETVTTDGGDIGFRSLPSATSVGSTVSRYNSNDIQWVNEVSDYAARLWWPDPEFSALADSPIRAVLDICEELLLLSRDVRATARSRLANNGILLIPQELEVVRNASAGANLADDENVFLREMLDTATAALTDEGSAAAVVPVMMTGPGEHLEKVRHFQIARPEHAAGIAARGELIGRLATGVDLPAEVLTGKIDLNHWPCDQETEVYTYRGFLTYDRLTEGDLCLTLNHETGTTEWLPLSGVITSRVVDREMVRVKTAHVDALTTLDHRWPVLRDGQREWTDGAGLRPTDRIIRAAPHTGLPTVPKYSDAFVELVAWHSEDGACIGTTPQVRIGKSHKENPEKVAAIRRVLTDLYGPARTGPPQRAGKPRSGDPDPWWKEDTQARGMTLFCLNKAAAAPLLAVVPGRDKAVPTSFIRDLTYGQLLLFLETFAYAQGGLRDGGGLFINQRDPARLEAVILAATLAGRPLSTRTRHYTTGFKEGDQHYVNVPVKNTTVPVGRTTRERYTGVIFCPRLPPNGSFLARRHGDVYFTGQSAWQVDDDTFRHHIEPLVIVEVDALTAGFLRVYLEAAGIAADVAADVFLWYDPTELVTHPDRSDDAFKAWDRLAISDEALRNYLGFPDTDEPTFDEILMRLVGRSRTIPPDAWPVIFKRLGIDMPAAPAPVTVISPSADEGNPEQPEKGPPPEPTVSDRQTRPAEPAIAAAASPPAVSRAAQRLTDIDRSLRERLTVAANLAVKRALERAGARIVSKARTASGSVMRDAIRDTPAWRIAMTVGPAITAAAGVTEQEIVAATLDELRDQWDRWVADGQQQALRVAARIAGLDVNTAYAQVAGKFAEDRAAGWQLLADALRDHVHALLTEHPATGELPEVDVTAERLVPTGVVRAALAVAGGFGRDLLSAGVGGDYRPVDPAEPYGQIGTGTTITGLLSDAGAEVQAYQWVHGAAEHPFPPHEDLDGLTFGSFTDGSLAVPEDMAWAATHFTPGDHAGCTCDFTPMWLAPSDVDVLT